RLRNSSDRSRYSEILKKISEKFEYVRFTEELSEVIETDSERVISTDKFEKDQFDFLISVGGDGTILESVRKVGRSGIPIFGVNAGRMGFLASTPQEGLDQALERLIKGDFFVAKRSMIQAKTTGNIFGEENYALNEIGVHKHATSSMIIVHTYLDDFFLNSYWADGLIISTPTGSTGYSLSVGGPIVSPVTQNLVITPIAPHNLNVRPLVIDENRVVKLKIEATEPNFLISLDSESRTVDQSTTIEISKADFRVGLIRFEKHDYFDTLRNKLMWGIDRRN
ncbi:MAG: NAD kinase, partial [Flavobacteriales bacterium]|nr:NAD kinase [Flavobacteriales bacterium]